MNRRRFLNCSAAAAVFPYLTSAPVLGANDRIQLGFIGLGGRAKWLIQNEEFPGAEIVALADCALPRTQEAAGLKPEGSRWKKYQDYRKMLEKEKLDAVFVETTTHARVLIMIEAMQAGLDVYGEKPLTLTIAEGRTLVNATRRYNRVLQTGSQQRSIPINAWASRQIREGVLGKVRTVLTYNFLAPIGWYPKPNSDHTGRTRLESMVQPNRTSPISQTTPESVVVVLGLRWRWPKLGSDRLGHPLARPGPVRLGDR